MRKAAGASPPSSIINHEEGGAPWGKQETLAGMGLEPGNPVSPRKPVAGGAVTQESPTPPWGMEGDSLGGTQAQRQPLPRLQQMSRGLATAGRTEQFPAGVPTLL